MFASAVLGLTKTNIVVVSEFPKECGLGINDSPPVVATSEFSMFYNTNKKPPYW